MMTCAWLSAVKKQLARSFQSNRRGVRRQRQYAIPGIVEQIEPRLLLSAVVLTNQHDYAPGDTALITTSNDSTAGQNFSIGETVTLQVTRTDGGADYPQGNQPWSVTDGGVGDSDGLANGVIQTSWFVEDQYVGASLLLTATGSIVNPDTGTVAVATTAFTDALTITSITPNSGPIAGGTSVSIVGTGFTSGLAPFTVTFD